MMNQYNVSEIEKNIIKLIGANADIGGDVLGVEVDFESGTFTRLSNALGREAGADFDEFAMYGGRRRCNLSDNGVVNAYCGDVGYVEDGSNGQVMVEQPVVYYKTVPIKFRKLGRGYSLSKVRYYISMVPRFGFKRHPAFYTRDGLRIPVEKIYLSVYEGCGFDVLTNTYWLNDEQEIDFTVGTGSKLSSISGAKPASGSSQTLTRQNGRIIANNRGVGWHLDDVFVNSLNFLLFIIEYCSIDCQADIGMGVVNKAQGTANESEITGGTSNLGNNSGMADGTDGLVSVAYRGQENLWGNMFSLEDGIFFETDMSTIQPHISLNVKNESTYKYVGFDVANTNGYITAIGYSEEFDYLFLATGTRASASGIAQDYWYGTQANSDRKYSMYGGRWSYESMAGLMHRHIRQTDAKGIAKNVRLCYFPTEAS